MTWGSRGSEFDFVISRLGESRIRGQRIMFQGVGDGRECRFWAPYEPAHLVGVDLFPDPLLEIGVAHDRVSVVAGDLTCVPFRDGTFQGAASINTWEHVVDLEPALSETRRVVVPGGWFLATFGPLYKAVGGDHLGRLRGGLAHAYNHLLLDPDEYANFVDHMTVEGVDVVEGAFTGSRQYIELDLFSHASWGDYLELFRRMLDLEVFTVHVDPESIEFRDRFPGKWAAIIDRGYAEEDLLASSITVVGRFRH